MSLLHIKRFMAALAFILTTTPALSKSLSSAQGLFTESGQFNAEYIPTVLMYSPLLILIDVAFTLVFLYYFRFLKKYRNHRQSKLATGVMFKNRDQ